MSEVGYASRSARSVASANVKKQRRDSLLAASMVQAACNDESPAASAPGSPLSQASCQMDLRVLLWISTLFFLGSQPAL